MKTKCACGAINPSYANFCHLCGKYITYPIIYTTSGTLVPSTSSTIFIKYEYPINNNNKNNKNKNNNNNNNEIKNLGP
jgi:hypothetical protein